MITSKRLLEQLHTEQLKCATVIHAARHWLHSQLELNNNALRLTKAETIYWKKRALAAEEELQQRIINQPKPRHCIDCAPEFIDCWNDGTKCIKRPAPPDSGQAGSGEGGARLAKMLVDDATFAGVLAECDNRKLLWLAMQTKAWMDTEILGKDAAILAEVESRLYPEYDGDKVKMTEWGWDIDGDEIRYVLDGQPSAPPQTLTSSEYEYLGNYSAVDPAYSRDMYCDDCQVRWTGCWDNFMCPNCGNGELPSSEPRLQSLGQAGSGACEYCGGEGVVDSGGVTPWGEGINVPCGACTPTEPDPAPAQTARELGERAIDDLLNQAQPIPQLAIDHIRHIANRCAQAEGEIIIAQARADRAEADIAAITANCLKLSQIVEQVRAERDRLREALDSAITFIKKLNATTNQHGRQYRSRCGQFLATLNQTTNDK